MTGIARPFLDDEDSVMGVGLHDGDDGEDDGPVGQGNQLVSMLYAFIKDCSSSQPARVWGWAMAVVVSVQYVCLCLESLDGPNHHGAGMATTASNYPFLPSSDEYWQLYISYYMPLIFDASLRIFVLAFVFFGAENRSLRAGLQRDPLAQCLLAGDILCIVPFVINVSLLKPSRVALSEAPRALLRLLELSSATRVLRLAKDIPSIQAFQLAMARAVPKLVMPCFFFVVVVTSAASVLYFVEPCFDVTSCAWRDLVGATFFAAASMTMTGYGNQVPQYEYARFITVLVMLSGTLLISMPLVIIGSEYSDVCLELMEQEQWQQQKSQANADGKEMWEAITQMTPFDGDGDDADAGPGNKATQSPDSNNDHTQEQLQQQQKHTLLVAAVQSSQVVEAYAHLAEAVNGLKAQCDDASRITPSVLNSIYMVDVWLDPFLTSLNDLVVEHVAAIRKQRAETKQDQFGVFPSLQEPTRRLSVLRHAREVLGINGDSFLLEPEDMSKQSIGEIIEDSRIEFLNPHPITLSFRGRIWVFLHIPSSSWKARCARVLLLIFIAASVLIFYTETIAGFNVYNESSRYCEEVVALYCAEKARDTDPGCFVQQEPTMVLASVYAADVPLKFFCSDTDCFGMGFNFGSLQSALSCANAVQPFQSLADLTSHYGAAGMFTTREKMNTRSAICTRMECVPRSDFFFDASGLWYYGELITSAYFTLEVVLRVFASTSYRDYLGNAINLCDILALVPFYIEIAYMRGTVAIDFSVLSSSPLPVFLMIAKSLKVFRLLKVSRYLRASKTLIETLKRVLYELAGVLGFLISVIVMLAIVLDEVEGSNLCFVGDASCKIPNAVAKTSQIGDRVPINENGEYSAFPTAFSGIWFGFVTLTMTGFGDVVPITYGGKFVNIFLMIGALCYVAIPVTIAASTFFHIHEKFMDTEYRSMIGERSKKSRNRRSEACALKRLQPILASLTNARHQLATFLGSLQRPPPTQGAAQKIVHLPLDAEKSWLLEQASMLAASIACSLAACRRDILNIVHNRLQGS